MRFIAYIVLLIIISNFALASIGVVSDHKGEAKIERKENNKEVSVEKNTDVFSYDTIKTGQGRTGITFVDDTFVEITEHSKLIIDEFVYDPNTKKGGLSLKASLGTVKYASGQIAKNSKQNVKISTPTATIAVRGTDFAMIIDEKLISKLKFPLPNSLVFLTFLEMSPKLIINIEK